MIRDHDNQAKLKLSPEFAARLSQLEPQQIVRAIVLLRTDNSAKAGARRQSRTERQAAIEAMRGSAQEALSAVDDILDHFDGHRQAEKPDVLGSIPVETTAAGIKALAASEWVRAILEDQPIHGNPLGMSWR
jgi:hypothetical protein